jgi:hypothetical protein
MALPQQLWKEKQKKIQQNIGELTKNLPKESWQENRIRTLRR